MANNRAQQQYLEDSPSSEEPFRKRIRIDDALAVISSYIPTTASYHQQTGQVPPGEPMALSARTQGTLSVEDALIDIIKRRLTEGQPPVYIPPMAKANLLAHDDDLFPLMDKVQEFLASDRQVMLILGDSGAGKSTFNKYLELELMRTYTRNGPIPLSVNLPAIREPEEDMIVKQLRNHNLMEDQIQEMKQHRQFIVICDGYDESQLTTNVHTSNFFNRPGQWDVKLIISCRSQYLGQDYHDRFVPKGDGHYSRPALDLFQEAAIAPFSKEQIQDYVEQYVPLELRTWTTQDYMDRLTTIPNLMDLVKNPFLLSLSLEALPKVTEEQLDLSTIKITRVKLYDTFVEHWLDVNKRRLQGSVLSKEDRVMLEDLLDAGFVMAGVDFSTKLASAIFENQEGNPVVQYIHRNDKKSWKGDFFGPDPEIRMLRESSPLTRTGSLFRFIHRSMLEYFISRAVFDPSGHVDNQDFPPHPNLDSSMAQPPNVSGPLFTRSLLTEPSIIQFLCERVKQYLDFEKQLLVVIEQSKTDPAAATAAANAITILVRAGVRLNGADLRGIRIPGADLSDSQLDSAQLQGADLTGVTFARSWMRRVDLSGAQMDDVRFGELPFLYEDGAVHACAYSPNGGMLAVGGDYRVLNIYDTTTWNGVYQHLLGGTLISCIAFSPSNQQLVYGGTDRNVRIWNFTNNDTVLDMKGHAGMVCSVVFSPCGKQLASTSNDKTVRLWSTETGECMSVLEGHTARVVGVTYCADGKRVVSGSSNDETIRVWDSETGEPVACWNIAQEEDSPVTFSADGQWVAVNLVGGKIQISNVFTGEPGSVLDSERNNYRISFSPNGLWIVTSAYDDNTLQLWDISSGLLISSFPGHVESILTCNFSPSNFQIASGDGAGYVRLWEVDTSRAILNSGRPTSPVFDVTYSPDGRSVLSAAGSYSPGVFAPLPLKMGDDVLRLAFSPDSNQIATGHKDGTIRLWSRQADTAECTLLGHTNWVDQLAYSPCSRWVVSTASYEARLWDLHTNEHPGVIGLRGRFVKFCITPSGQIVLSHERLVRLHDPRAQDPCTALKEISMDCFIFSMDCSPDGQELAFGAIDDTVYLWDFHSEKPYAELKGHDRGVNSVAYSPCGKWILASSDDNAVRVWRLRTGEFGSWSCVAVVGGCTGNIWSVAWNPILALEFVTGCGDGSVRVWRIASRDDADGGDVSVSMLWGNDVGLFCASDLTFTGAIGLSTINQKLLVQRGAIDGSPPSEAHESNGVEADQCTILVASM